LSLPAPAFEAARLRMEMPTPRVELAMALRGIATSAVDVSDGLVGDLGHVLAASAVGATIEAEAAVTLLDCAAHVDAKSRLEFVLSGGDDYELLFTAPASARDAVRRAAAQSGTRVTRIGRIDAERGLRVVDAQGRALDASFATFDHFAG
jgi:thiamine-monophosphate kinase